MVSLLDELAGRGMLVERDDRWVLAVSIDEVRAHRPASVKQLIDMQLDRLPAAEQRVLEAASIVGTEFSTNLVAAALELSADQVDDTCDALARRSLFLRAEPDGRYAVTHALIQEVCVERSESDAAAALAPARRRGARTRPAHQRDLTAARETLRRSGRSEARRPRLCIGRTPGGPALRDVRRRGAVCARVGSVATPTRGS